MPSTPSHWCYSCTCFVQISPETTSCPHCSSAFVHSLRRHPHQPSRTFHLYYDDVSSPSDPTRPQNPPASKSAVRSLPTVLIGPDRPDPRCAICTDPFETGSEAREMPCRHVYHSDCILPWLSIRNTCPVCRHALPEDPTEETLAVWRLPGGGFAVGRWRGGVEREVPVVYTEMDPRRRVFTRARSRGGFFRKFMSFFGRVRSGSSRPSIERSRSGSVFGSLARRRSRGWVLEEGSGMSRL